MLKMEDSNNKINTSLQPLGYNNPYLSKGARNGDNHYDYIKNKVYFKKFNRMIKSTNVEKCFHDFRNLKKNANVNKQTIEYFKAFFNNNPGNLVYEEDYQELWYFFKFKSENKKARIVDQDTSHTIHYYFEDRILPKYTFERYYANGDCEAYKKLFHPIHPYSTILYEESRRQKKKNYIEQQLKKQREQEAGEKLRKAQQIKKTVYDSDSTDSNIIANQNDNSNKRKRKETVKLKNVDASDGMEDDSDRISEEEEEEANFDLMLFKRRYSQLNGQLLQGYRLVKSSNYYFLDYYGLIASLYGAAAKIINYKELLSAWLNEFMDASGGINQKNDSGLVSQDEVHLELIKACNSCSDYALKGRAHFHQNMNVINEFYNNYKKWESKDASMADIIKVSSGLEGEKTDYSILLMVWATSLEQFYLRLLFKLIGRMPLDFMNFSKDSFFQKNRIELDTEFSVAKVTRIIEETSIAEIEKYEEFGSNFQIDIDTNKTQLDMIMDCYFMETDVAFLKVKDHVYENYIQSISLEDGVDLDMLDKSNFDPVNYMESSNYTIPIILLNLIDLYKDNNVYDNPDVYYARVLGTNIAMNVSSKHFVLKKNSKVGRNLSDYKYDVYNKFLKRHLEFYTKEYKKSLYKLKNIPLTPQSAKYLTFFSTKLRRSNAHQMLHNYSFNNPQKELMAFLVNADYVGNWYAIKKGEINADATRIRSDSFNQYNAYNKKILFEVGFSLSYTVTCIFKNLIYKMYRQKTIQGYRCYACMKPIQASNYIRCNSCAKCYHTDCALTSTSTNTNTSQSQQFDLSQITIDSLTAQFDLAKLMEPDDKYNSTLTVEWECKMCKKCSNCLQTIGHGIRSNQDNYAYIDGTELNLGIDYLECNKCGHAFHLNCMYKKEIIGEEYAYVDYLKVLNVEYEKYEINMRDYLKYHKRNSLSITCTNCLECGDCQGKYLSSSNDTISFTKSHGCCDRCHRLRDKGENCAHCHMLCKDNEESILCNYCIKWYHRHCERISDDEWIMLNEQKDSKYKCYFCRRERLVEKIKEFINKIAKFDEDGYFNDWLDIYSSQNYKKIVERPICIERIYSYNEKQARYVYGVNDTMGTGIRFKAVEFIEEFLLICSNAKKFNRVNENIYKSAQAFEQKILYFISNTGFSKSLIPYIDRNDQLKVLEIIKNKQIIESNDKPKKSKVKYQKINPLIKGSSRVEYFKLDPVVSHIYNYKQLLHKQCLRCGGSILDGSELQCNQCYEHFHSSCCYPVSCSDAVQNKNGEFTCQECSECYMCKEKISEKEIDDKKEMILNCTNQDCVNPVKSFHYSCYDSSQLNSDIIPYIAYKFLCKSCFTCRICSKFITKDKTQIQGYFELKDKPYFACRISYLQEYISKYGYDNSMCISCFSLTLVSLCEICDTRITTRSVNDELAEIIKEKLDKKLSIDYISCAICLKKFHLRCIKARSSNFNLNLNNLDSHYECKNCANTKQHGRNHNSKNVQFVHKFLSSLIRFQFSKFDYHSYRLVYDYYFFESRFMLLDNPHIKYLFEKFKINNKTSKRKKETKGNALNFCRIVQENTLEYNDYTYNGYIDIVKCIDINPFTQLDYVHTLLNNHKKTHQYFYNAELPNYTYTYLKYSKFRDSSYYSTLFENYNKFMMQEIYNNYFQHDFTKLISKYNFIDYYSMYDWSTHISNQLLNINKNLSYYELITNTYYRKNFTYYYYQSPTWDKIKGMLYINDLNFHIANSITNVCSLNYRFRFVSEAYNPKDLLISDINSVNEMKHIYYSSLKLLYYTSEFSSIEDMSMNEKYEYYNMIYTMYGIVKANFNDFLDSDDKNLMLKLVYADINSDFDLNKFNYKNQAQERQYIQISETKIDKSNLNQSKSYILVDSQNENNSNIAQPQTNNPKNKAPLPTSIQKIASGEFYFNPNYQKCILCKRGYCIEIRVNKRTFKCNFALIPCFSTYLHRACMYYSPEVIELQDGSLLNGPRTILVAKSCYCTKCNTDYANISCMSCRKHWHLPCLLENKGLICSKETNMCFCNWNCLEQYNSDTDKMQPLFNYKTLNKIDPLRFMYIARLDTEYIDYHYMSSKITTAKRCGLILGFYNRIGEYVVLNEGKYTEKEYASKIANQFVFPELYAFYRRVCVDNKMFIVIVEYAKDNLVNILIMHLGEENVDNDTISYPSVSKGINSKLMKLISTYKNTLNNVCSNRGRIEIKSGEFVNYSNFKKVVRDIFNPEFYSYKTIDSIQGSVAADVYKHLISEYNVNKSVKQFKEDKFTNCGSIMVQNWFYNNSLITDQESDLLLNLEISEYNMKSKKYFDYSKLNKLEYVQNFHYQIKSVFEKPDEYNRVSKILNDRGERTVIKDNLTSLPNPRFNLQHYDSFATAKREYLLSSKPEKLDSDLYEYSKMSLRERYEVFVQNKTYKFVSSQSKIHGIGLFATQNIHREEIIVEYLGEVVSEMQSDSREKVYEKLLYGGCYMFSLEDNYIVDGSIYGNFARYINHSCSPNSYAEILNEEGVKQILIIANTDIEKGTEITYDYKFAQEGTEEKCYCGSVNCISRMN
eukprot:Mrub_00033.p1 GENE.Mrub_00033~~Mrub_00033.p1  ORF type:complete len:2544 (+),score=404.63 Mrub_00033:876-8507(+)